jgi:integrase/recombinase XerD
LYLAVVQNPCHTPSVALRLFRRHSEDCKVHSTKLSSRAKRHYRSCECKIWITGTTPTERYPRQSTGMTDWDEAEAYVRSLIADTKDTTIHGPTIADCVRRFLDSHKENIGHRALAHHRLTLTRLEDFAKSRNKLFMRDLTVDLCEDFKTYGLAKFKSTTRSLVVTKLRFFLREAHRRGWITEALHEKVRAIRPVYEQKQPYTDAEVNLILAHVNPLNSSSKRYASQPGTFRLLLELMLETGLRVSDAIRYDPAHCKRSEHFWVYSFQPVKQRKNEKPKQAEIFLSERLKLAIDGAVWFSKTLPFAYRAFDATTNPMEHAVYEYMQAIGDRAGVADCRPHRLRDTFAVRLLLKGVPLEDVSRLLCHASTAITEKFYSAWIPARRNRLEGLLAEALMDSRGN